MSTDGTHKVTVSIEDPAGTNAALAWARATYSKLLKDAGSVDTAKEQSSEDAPQCKIHRLPMVKVQGRLGVFWSCHQKNSDGAWCSYRPRGA